MVIAEVAHVGEVGQAHAPGLMRLAENHLALGAMQRRARRGCAAPASGGRHRPSSGWRRTISSKIAIGRRPGAAVSIGDDLLLENGAERIGAAPLARLSLCRWQAGILLDAIGRGGAERRLGRCDGRSSRSDGTS